MAFYDVFNLTNGILTKKQPGWIEDFFDGITGVDLPDGYPLFKYITGSFTVTFPDIKSDSKMGAYAMRDMFEYSTGLTSVSFPELTILSDSTKQCLSRCFTDCTGLQTISFPKLSYVCNYAMSHTFDGCTSLSGISFPNLGYVGEYGMSRCFDDCSGITGTINFPLLHTIKSGGMSGCFRNCSGITAVYFPSLIFDAETVENTYNSPLGGAFYGCTDLTEIHFRQDQQQYESYLGIQPLIDQYWAASGSYNPNLQILFDL